MNTNRGIFDSLPNPGAASPFAPFNDPAPAAGQPASPFETVPQRDSPFAVVDDAAEARPVEPGKPAKLPERRATTESPFQIAETHEPFGYEAVPSPFGVPPVSPFGVPAQAAAPSPFSVEPAPPAPAFGAWPPATAASPFQPAPAAAPAAAPVPAAFVPAEPVPARVAEVAPAAEVAWSSIRQLELRAIFGVDREMTIDEILQRSRKLNGIRHIARIGSQELAAVESLKQTFVNLGFGSGGMKLSIGSVPIEFIREGNVLLAVQTEGGFAPGVRETLMLVARELDRMS